MRIKQGYVSKSIQDFQFLQKCDLDDYNDTEAPAIFFGCYRYEDYAIISQHKGFKLIFWAGQDALDLKWDLPGVYHCSPHPKIVEFLKGRLDIKLLRPLDFGTTIIKSACGPMIYAYAPSGNSSYHGGEIITQLLSEGYPILLGDGKYSQHDWHGGKSDEYYSQCYLGLVLSSFTGGGASIVEIGLRGRKCVTNVLDMPHTIKWQNIDDIKKVIEDEKNKIGVFDLDLAHAVRNSLGTYDFLETDYYK